MARLLGKRKYIPQHLHHGKLQRDVRIDNVRGILIMLVVIGHFLLPFSEVNTRLITGLIYLIYVFHMPCFVMVSGYYSKSVFKGGRFRWGKAVQLFWLYLVYKTIVFFTEWLAYGYTSAFPRYLHESGAPWYLMSLATWYLTIPLFNRFRGRKISVVIVALMFAAVAFLKYVIHIGDLFSFDRTLSFMPFFYIGFFGTQNALDDYLMHPVRPWVDLIAAFLALLVFIGAKQLFFKYNLIVYGADYTRFPEEMQGSLWIIELLWCAVALIISLGLIGKTLNRRMAIFTDIGKNTLQIYFLHRPIRDILMYKGFYEKLDPMNRLHVLFLVLFSVGLSVILGTGVISGLFKRLRTAFDPLLEKYNAL